MKPANGCRPPFELFAAASRQSAANQSAAVSRRAATKRKLEEVVKPVPRVAVPVLVY
jgi:hypothetical protein